MNSGQLTGHCIALSLKPFSTGEDGGHSVQLLSAQVSSGTHAQSHRVFCEYLTVLKETICQVFWQVFVDRQLLRPHKTSGLFLFVFGPLIKVFVLGDYLFTDLCKKRGESFVWQKNL